MPQTSVVVPFHGVEEHLGACLESLARQAVRDLEVVMVDDGSPDGSAAVAARFAEEDRRFRLVRQDHRGPGAARNTGVRHASGEFLAFVDGDGVVTRHGHARMLTRLTSSGSDLATGNVLRLGARGTRQSALVAEVFRTAIGGRPTHVSRFPALLTDRLATNKLFRRSFWDEHGLAFPEDVLFEDVAVTIPAHVLARSVDVVRRPVYLWRVGEGGRRPPAPGWVEPRAVRDRHRAVDTVSRFLAAREAWELKRTYDEACAARDFRVTLQRLDEAEEEVRALFLDLANDFFDRAHPEVFDRLRSLDRLKYHFVRRRMLPEVLTLVRFDKSGGALRHRVVRTPEGIEGDYPFRTDQQLAVPRDLYRLDEELALHSRVDDVWWEGDRLHVAGYAYVRFLELADESSGELDLTLVSGEGEQAREVPLRVTRTPRPDVTAEAPEALYCYDWCGFHAHVPARRLLAGGSRGETVWRLRVRRDVRGVVRERVVAATGPGRAQRPGPRVLPAGRVTPVREDGSFAVLVERGTARVECAQLDGPVVELHGVLRGGRVDPAAARLLVNRREGATQLELPVAFSAPVEGSGRSFVSRVPVLDLLDALEVGDAAAHSEEADEGVVWTLALRLTARGRPRWLVAPDDPEAVRGTVAGREVLLRATRQGRLALVDRAFRPEVDSVRWTGDDALLLEGWLREPGDARWEMALVAVDGGDRHAVPLVRQGERFSVRLTPAGVRTLAGTLPLPAGRWRLRARAPGSGDDVLVGADRSVLPVLPATRRAGAKDLVLHDVHDGGLELAVSDDLAVDERGPYRQHVLQEESFPAFLRRPVRDTVLLEGYGGRQFADSPRAVAEELLRRDTGMKLRWAVEDAQTALPDGIVPVRKYSRDWYEALARSRYVVLSTYRPLQSWMATHPDQVVVQTWHGAPFKRVGFDSERIANLAAADYHDRLRREIDGWTYLVSPNPVATPILRSAFRYTGELLETGYPRTDVLARPGREQRAAEVRGRLGLPEGLRVVLYAPTFRDDRYYQRNRFRLDLRLDVDRIRDVLGPDGVLLVRRHQKMVDVVPAGDHGVVRDVSAYPDVNELLLVTDVLVTDYSSVSFDFAVTGRPMVFFTYDLDDYRDRLRGFYFDPERLPGPLLDTSEKVVEALADVEGLRREYASAYAEFARDFCAWDDGGAAARVVDRMLAT